MQNITFVHIINRNKIYTLYTTMKKNILTLLLLFTLFGIPFQSIAQTNYNLSQMKREKLGRRGSGGQGALKNSENVFGVLVGADYLSTSSEPHWFSNLQYIPVTEQKSNKAPNRQI